MISTKVIIPLDKIYAIEQKLCHFGTLNAYFIILPHHFTTSHLSDIFNSILYIKIIFITH